MLLEEPKQMLARDSTVLRAWNAISTQAARIEPLANGPGRDFANLRDLTGCKHFLHRRGLHSPIFGARLRRLPHPSGLTQCRRGDSPGSAVAARTAETDGPAAKDGDRNERSDPAPVSCRTCDPFERTRHINDYVVNGRLDRKRDPGRQPKPHRQVPRHSPLSTRGCPVSDRRRGRSLAPLP